MTSDNLSATLIDDSCFDDIFTMQSQFLDDFEFGLEANNIDSLLELFEEREKRNSGSNVNYLVNNNNNIVIKNNIELNDKKERNSNVIISSPKVRKSSPNSSTDMSPKSKGTSLLAKPKKNTAKRSMININDRDFGSFSSHLLQEHDYCLISDDNKRLYNKLPDYLTELSGIANDGLTNCSQTNTFDKIPNYIKGFLNFNDNIDENIDNFLSKSDENLLLELNEAYIEAADVFFDSEVFSDSKVESEVDGEEDFNVNSDSSLSLPTSEELKDMKQMNDILNEQQFLPQNEQKVYKNNNNYNISDGNDEKGLTRRSRSMSREPRSKKFVQNRTRRRRLSTRSSVDSSSDSDNSRSSSCSSRHSYSSRSSNESKINFKLSNSIIRNESSGQEFSRKRSLKESYCQNNYRSKIRANFDTKSCVESNVKYMKSCSKSMALNAKQDIEERKIIYVGKIPDGTTKTDVRHWFGRFGAIKEVSIHFRDFGDNYAFVTFYRRTDAFEAIEHANDDTRHPKFDLSFGGRRQFCKTRYEDLDFAEDDSSLNTERMDFDSLLRSTRAKLKR